MNPIAIGRLLRSNTMGCVIGCKLTQSDTPSFGDMLRIPLTDGSQLYGLVYDIHIDDDGLVRQLITAPDVPAEIIEDNRRNRNVPLEMSVVFIGWQANGSISQTRVPRPPLTLDEIFPCGDDEMLQFINSGKFGYLRTILRIRIAVKEEERAPALSGVRYSGPSSPDGDTGQGAVGLQ